MARKYDFILLKMPELFGWNLSGISEFKSRNDEYLMVDVVNKLHP